ncbi:HDR108Cp [Eremothecium sinecaudum]|uniref:HDR108Cp n=1 Tax=Eremothecium sinecaudum TaxID=45286 RepID=A0A109UZ44_9SACH|nr:HDR108Cp [Eremothecium sinecaudum]AMD20850.1 HDR108Cp [Eremothecium sinecaudum]
MNQQPSVSPSACYTLPGVMHYLQTEFTKNERDRINWELERCEMKARIAQLEGENRDLRYECMKLKQESTAEPEDISYQEPQLIKSKLSVQENVKEIVYLLKSPQVTEQLDAWNNKCSSIHPLESMNLNTRKPSGKDMAAESGSGAPMQDSPVSPKVKITSPQQPLSPSLFMSAGQKYESDQETIVLEQQSSALVSPSSGGGSANIENITSPISLRSNKMSSPKKVHLTQPASSTTPLAYVDKLTLFQNNLLTLTGDVQLKHWLISSDLELGDKLTIPTFHGLGQYVIAIFWWDAKTFITIDESGLKVWSVEIPEPIMQWDCFQNLEFENIDIIDFKNKWLVLKLGGRILIWKLDISNEDNMISIASNYELLLDDQKPAFFILGLTEESLIVLYLDPCHWTIYNFQGKVLQQYDLSEFTTDLNPKGNNVTRLVLNKKTSKLLIQINNQLIVYSFDQKKTVATFELESIPSNIVFKFNSEIVVLGYCDGTIEVRDLKDFDKIIKSYNHYRIENNALSSDVAHHRSDVVTRAEGEKEIPMKNFINMDVAIVNDTPAIVSGGDSGLVRLVSLHDVAF